MSWWTKTKRNKDIDVVLSSSGVRAPCFIGAIEGLLEKGYTVRRIAGTSGGAIIASAYALGMDIDTMKKKVSEVPYNTFKDFRFRNLLSIENPSIYSGKPLEKYYKDIFGEATLQDFKIDCRISVVTVIGRQKVVLSRDTHPDLPVWKAVRMSSTIPLIFPYLDLEGIPVTDGGLLTKMFDVFPDYEREIVAFRPRSDHGVKIITQKQETGSFWGQKYLHVLVEYIKILTEFFLEAAENQHVPQEEWGKTIIIPTLEVGGFDFDLSPQQANDLIHYGYRAVIASSIV